VFDAEQMQEGVGTIVDNKPTDASFAPAPIASWRWGVIWLMFLATLINYMDRQTLMSTAKHIKDEFGLTEQGYGWVEFWFGISYGLLQFPAGYLADRLNLRWLYVCALLLWSAAGFFTGLAGTVVTLALCRIVLGVGEAFNWPCALGIVRRLIPQHSRSFANGIFHSGASAGAVLTPLLALAIVGPDGENWRLLFIIVGAMGLVWAVLWLWFMRGERAAEISQPSALWAADAPGEEPSPVAQTFAQVLRLRTFWIGLAISLTINFCWHFYRTWLPRYLDVDLKLTSDQIQWVLAGFFVAADVGALGGGYLARRLTYHGFSVERSRKLVLLGSALLCLLSTPAALFNEAWITLPLIFLVSVGAMAGFPILFALGQDISPAHTSLCVGICGSLAWIVIAVLHPPIGHLVDQIGTFAPALIAVGCIPLVGAAIGFLWPERRR
jgi:ACS family hexuronate transporter-like MFS transporter